MDVVLLRNVALVALTLVAAVQVLCAETAEDSRDTRARAAVA